ncbi:MAG TPA: hypothetical protein VMZ90_06775 [Vicinamibacterales bacterium]|nr:hypothetical protein [Vicinamibacterales bacterium]
MVIALLAVSGLSAQMPNPKAMSGIPRPDTTVPVGTVSVRVIRGGFDKNIPNQPVEFTIDRTARVVNTGPDGRALVNGVRKGASVVAVTTVDGERLESQSFTMSSSGVLLVLVATEPADAARAAEDKSLATAPPAKGTVVLGPESRVIVQLGEDGLNVFYLVDILNTARTPIDIGGPLIIDLPQGARSAAIDPETSSKQASANGPRIIVTGPFAPGVTHVQAAYELPYRGPAVRLEQVWPATLQQLVLLVEQHGPLDIASPQIASRAAMRAGDGKAFINAAGPAIQAGQRLTLDISGLPYHSVWPRWVALAFASGFVMWGLWAGVAAPARRRV